MDEKQKSSDRRPGTSASSGQGRKTDKPRERTPALVGAAESGREGPADAGHRERRSSASEENQSLFERLTDFTSSAYRLAKRTTDGGIRVGRALIKSQDQIKLMLQAGESLRDLREVAGLTIAELSDALNLRDKTLLEAVENGTATLSFELILRLSSLLARNDPVPFILRYTRTYNPELWKILHDWGLGRIPLQYEREREFINIYRRHDAARELSDQGFQHVLKFTQEAFELALHFVAQQENLSDRINGEHEGKEEPPARSESRENRDKGNRTGSSSNGD